MKNKCYLGIYLLLLGSIARAQDTIYFDKNWNKIPKGEHVFYRPMPLQQVGMLLLLKDYYRNGNLQFQGYVKPGNEDAYTGDAYWYNENGTDHNSSQYDNRSTVKELTYFNADGTVWQKIRYDSNGHKSRITTYFNGKELFSGSIIKKNTYTGSFSPSIPEWNYDHSEREKFDTTGTEPVPVETTAAPAPAETAGAGKPKTYYREVIYWKNGKIASEKKFENTLYGTGTPLEEKCWDEKGKLISEINFEYFDPGKKYIETEYYTRNNFATRIKVVRALMNKIPEGISTYFTEEGQVVKTEKYHKGLLSEVVTFPNGTSKISSYRDGGPYEGEFSEPLYDKTTFYTMLKGRKEGTVVTKDSETSAVLAEGTYRNGKPIDGTFYFDGDHIRLLQYKNGKQEGVQQIFANESGKVLSEAYEMKDSQMNGFRRIYKEGKLKYESLYSKGKIVSGVITKDDEVLTYSDGRLTERSVLADRYNEALKLTEKYQDGKISSVEYFHFTLQEKPQQSYKGLYRDGTPYQGYFMNQNLIDNIYLVDYYENGIIKYQYSFDLIRQLDNYKHYVYTTKAEFENGKIFNGPEYLLPAKYTLLKIDHEQGAIKSLEVNLFAMNYFNRINFIHTKDSILVNELESPYTLKIFSEDSLTTAGLYKEGELIRTQKPLSVVKEGTARSLTAYYLEGNQIKTLSFLRKQYDTKEEEDPNKLTIKIFSQFPLKTVSLDSVMNHFIADFKTDNIQHFEEVADKTFLPFTEDDFLSLVEYDENGKISFGIKIRQESTGVLLLEGFKDDQLKKSMKVGSVSTLIADNKKILKDFMNKLLNE